MKIFSNLEMTNGVYTNHLADWCYQNNREVLLTEAEHDFARYVFQPLLLPDGRSVKSIIIFPILNNGSVSGTLAVISFQKNSFSAYHCEIIRLLLGYISVAIENSMRHDELNRMKIRAERSEKFKEQFLANMSHEIRTPINAVTGMTHLLLERQPRPDQLRYLESIRNASDALLVIINDILDLSKIEAGKIELEKIDFSVDNLVSNVKEIMQFKTEEKGLAFETYRDVAVPPVLVGDPTRLTQILINLIGNAIKFTEKGGVTIRILLQGKTKHPVKTGERVSVRFEVEDTGIGMTKEQQGKLFRDYAQASLETARKYGGTGLGLSISRQLVNLQGGEIEVESEVDKGSRFFFTLPFPVSSLREATAREQDISNEMLQRLTGLRVLLADDNEYNRIVVRDMLSLRLKDIHIDEALDGKEVITLLSKNEYDIVLLDLVMPYLDGFEVMRFIRNDLPAPKKSVPVIALTASVVRSEIEKCNAAGMNGFIPKPFRQTDLFGSIYKAMSSPTSRIKLETKQPIVSIAVKQKPKKLLEGVVDREALEENAEGDDVRMKRFVELFLAKVPVGLEEISSAMNDKNYEKIRIAAHSMKPQLQFTGVTRAVELAGKIESNCLERKNIDQLPAMILELKKVCMIAIDELKEMKLFVFFSGFILLSASLIMLIAGIPC
jgi:signal transduction histidine kinase/CheY-like chemotaxis protein